MKVKDDERIQIKALNEISAKDIVFVSVSIKNFRKWNKDL